MKYGSHSRGNSIAEYALPTAIGVFVIVGAIGIFNEEIKNWFGNTMHFESASSTIVQPLATLVNSSDVVANFDSKTVRDILGNLDTTCVGSAGACFQSDARYQEAVVETSGGRGTKKFLDKQLTRVLNAFDELLQDRPDAEALKAKFRDLSNVGFEIANLQRQLSRAIAEGDKAAIAEMIKQINGGSITYRTQNPDGTYSYTTVTGNQSGSLIDQLRTLRNEIMNDPILATIPNAKETLDALYDLFEFDAVAMSTMVDGPPPVGAGTTIADMLKQEGETATASLLAAATPVNGQTTAGTGEVVKTDTDPKTKPPVTDADGTTKEGVKVDEVVSDTLKTIDQQKANEINQLAAKTTSVEAYKTAVAANTASLITADVIARDGSGTKGVTSADVAKEVSLMIDAVAKRATESNEIDAMFADGKLDAAERARLVEKTAEYLDRYGKDPKNRGYITDEVAEEMAKQLAGGSNPELELAVIRATAVKKEEKDIVERLTQEILTAQEKAEQAAKNGDGTTTTQTTTTDETAGAKVTTGSTATTTAEQKKEVVEDLVQSAVTDATVQQKVNEVAAADSTGNTAVKNATATAAATTVTTTVEDKKATDTIAADTDEKATEVEGQSTVTCKVGDGSTVEGGSTTGATSCVQ